MNAKLKKGKANKYVEINANERNTEHVKIQNQKFENTKCCQGSMKPGTLMLSGEESSILSVCVQL